MGFLYRLPDRGTGCGGQRVPATFQIGARTAGLDRACKSTGYSLKVQAFKREKLKLPFLKDVQRTDTGFRFAHSKAFPYHKYRDHHVHLGRSVRKEELAELYDIRRGSGRNIHSESAAPWCSSL